MKLSTLADLKFKPEALLELIALVESKTISSAAAQQVFAEMFDTGEAPAAIVQEKGLAQVSDTGAIEKFCDEAIAANPSPSRISRAGKVAALNSLKGQVMKLSKGKANPNLVGEILERKLKKLRSPAADTIKNRCEFVAAESVNVHSPPPPVAKGNEFQLVTAHFCNQRSKFSQTGPAKKL